jgi:hypothetical protein
VCSVGGSFLTAAELRWLTLLSDRADPLPLTFAPAPGGTIVDVCGGQPCRNFDCTP